MELCDKSARELSSMLIKGDTTCSEIIDSVLERISDRESLISAYITVDAEGAARRARYLDSKRGNRGELGPLWGIPVAVKDNICTRGTRTTCASRTLEEFSPPYNATAVERLLEAGAVVVGKTNLDEFGMGSSTEHSAFAKTRNPWDPSKVPGGSSGGSAAAVSAGEAVIALGSDTGGSVRLPAAFCGLVGLRPTYGTISRYGLVAFGSSMDQIGPITRDVWDCAAVLQALAGPDERDSTAISRRPAPFVPLPDRFSLKGKRIGIPRRLLDGRLDGEVRRLFNETIDTLHGLGGEIVDVELLDPSYAVAAYYIIANAEASSNLARYDGVRFGFRGGESDLEGMYRGARETGFGTEVKRRILLGTYVLSTGYQDEYYLKAARVRGLFARDLKSVLSRVDSIALPTAATAAFAFGERTDDPMSMYLTDVFTVAPCLAGIPAISLPMGLTSAGLPAGFQLLGPAGGEAGLLKAAHAYQEVTAFHAARPPRHFGRRSSTSESGEAREIGGKS